jgi:SAM-dependent methyltransferase
MAKEIETGKRLYIDENVTVHEGERAARWVAAKAAETPVDSARGVAQVNHDRWEEAQRYERRTWMERGRRVLSDRNEHHRKRFAGFAALDGRRFARGIELGCGPFTNLRLILEGCQIEEIHLLDPLIGDYLEHPFCKYRGRRLGGLLNDTPARLPGYLTQPLSAWRSKLNDLRIGGLFGRPVAVSDAMIETYAGDRRFDLVVMINVLEHCQDAISVFSKIDQLLLPDGVLVFHDKLYDAASVQRLLRVLYDAGHPLRVDRSVVEQFLAPRFSPLMRAEYPVHSEFRGVPFDYEELYFIGEKRAA